jgi:hypothetical protein
MSEEQRANNLGIDPNLRNTNPLEYMKQLQDKLDELTKGLVEKPPPADSEAEPPQE